MLLVTLIKIKYEQEQDATADLPCTDDLEAHRGKLPTWLRQEWSPRGDQARPHGCTVRYHQLEGDSRPPPTPRTSPRPPLRGCGPRLAVSLPAAPQSVLSCRTPAALSGGRLLKEASASEPSPLRLGWTLGLVQCRVHFLKTGPGSSSCHRWTDGEAGRARAVCGPGQQCLS